MDEIFFALGQRVEPQAEIAPEITRGQILAAISEPEIRDPLVLNLIALNGKKYGCAACSNKNDDDYGFSTASVETFASNLFSNMKPVTFCSKCRKLD